MKLSVSYVLRKRTEWGGGGGEGRGCTPLYGLFTHVCVAQKGMMFESFWPGFLI